MPDRFDPACIMKTEQLMSLWRSHQASNIGMCMIQTESIVTGTKASVLMGASCHKLLLRSHQNSAVGKVMAQSRLLLGTCRPGRRGEWGAERRQAACG